MNCKIGCSGYYYPEWKGTFYPYDLPKNQWFEYYCEHFNAIEMNMTFYKFPRAESLQNWYKRSPADFRFSVKAPRVITHFKRLKDSEKYLRDFYSAVERGLRDKLGCVLFQFPSSLSASIGQAERLANMLDRSVRNVVEFRHVSWWDQEIINELNQASIVMAGMSHPELPDAVIQSKPFCYYRFHGVPHLYHSSYDDHTLEHVFSQVTNQNAQESFVFFNNTISGAGLHNAKQFADLAELHT